MKKDDAEKGIRHFALQWMDETGYKPEPGYYPSFLNFRSWLDNNGYSHYLDFRSDIAPRHIAEGWFEDAIRRYWQACGYPHHRG